MSWVGGLAEWREGDTVFLSVAFTWRLDEAWSRAQFAKAQGLRVIAGGPAIFLLQMRHRLCDVAEVPTKTNNAGRLVGADYPEAILHHNPEATFASRGCDQKCSFCIVPRMEGTFTLIPDFTPRPILCDNNLSGLPADYQQHIIRRYQDAGVTLRDANSGFEPRSFTQEVYDRWKPLVNAGGGPWRFAYDDMKECAEARGVMRMLAGEPQKRKRVYCLIGNEPFADCMQRIAEIIEYGCEPHVQPFIKLNSLEREPHAHFDWTRQKLKDVARWANGFVWKKAPFAEYDRHRKNVTQETYDQQQGLFV